MRMKLLAVLAALVIAAGVVALVTTAERTKATVYKAPECVCCGSYVGYLRGGGFDVRVKEMEDVTPVKRSFGIPPDLESCHTVAVGGYAVEGHVPVEAIDRLLSEKPGIRGIALPGMPPGAPGMPGPKTESLVIYTIAETNPTVFMVR